MKKRSDGFRAGFRKWSFLQFVHVVRQGVPGASDLLEAARDHLWRSAVLGHVPGGLLQDVFMEIEEKPWFSHDRIKRAPDFFLDNVCSMILRSIRDRGAETGYLRGFIEAASRHMEDCGDCRRAARETFRDNVRVREILRDADAALSSAEADDLVAKVMARIRNLPDEEPPGLKLVRGGREDSD